MNEELRFLRAVLAADLLRVRGIQDDETRMVEADLLVEALADAVREGNEVMREAANLLRDADRDSWPYVAIGRRLGRGKDYQSSASAGQAVVKGRNGRSRGVRPRRRDAGSGDE